MKRIICVLLSLVLTLTAVSAFAAEYDSELEKLTLQFTKGSGLKGTLTLNASGSAEWDELLAPANGVKMQVRAIDPGKNGFQYRLYVEEEELTAMTEVVGDGTMGYFTSDFLMGEVYSFPAKNGLVPALVDLNTGSNSWYPLAAALLNLREVDRVKTWGPALAPFEAALESFMAPYMTVQVVTVDGETRVVNRYEIPAEAVKEKMLSVISLLLDQSDLLTLLTCKASDEQAALYLNPEYLVWYQQKIDALPLTGNIVLERTAGIKGETIGYLIDLPLSGGENGLTEITLMSNDGDMELYLIGETTTLNLSVTTDDGKEYTGHARLVRAEDVCYAVSYKLVVEKTTSIDDKARNHEDYVCTLTFEPDLSHLDVMDPNREAYADFEPVTVTLVMNLYSKSGDQNAVTANFDLTWACGDSTLNAQLALKTAAPWHLPEAPEGQPEDMTAMTAEQRADVLDDWLRNGLLQMQTAFPESDEPAENEEEMEEMATPTDMSEEADAE